MPTAQTRRNHRNVCVTSRPRQALKPLILRDHEDLTTDKERGAALKLFSAIIPLAFALSLAITAATPVRSAGSKNFDDAGHSLQRGATMGGRRFG